MLYLFHHVNFQVPAVVHLIHIARDNIFNAQMSIISDVQLGPAALQKFFLGKALGQHGRSSRFDKLSPGDLNVQIIWMTGLGISGFSEPSIACSTVGAVVASGDGTAGISSAEASGAAVLSSGSARTGSSAGLFFFALLLGFTCTLQVKGLVQKHK